MKNLTEEKIAFMRHIWTMNYSELGWGTPVVKIFEKYPFHLIAGIFSWMFFIPYLLTISVFLCYLPAWIFGSAFILLIIDSVYTSKKIYEILELCKTHIDSSITLEELIAVCQN
jgi:hypothetical protein